MTATVRHLTCPRVAPDKVAAAKAWLAGRQAWEQRLAELEHRGPVSARRDAERRWAQTA